MPSLLQALREIPVAVFDVETTGAAADLGDRIVEIGIVRLLDGVVLERYEQLIDPKRPMSGGAAAITGITPAMLDGQPTFADVSPRVAELLGGAIVVGHNVHFDLSFVHREFDRLRIDLCAHCGNAPVLDTVRIARRRFGRGGNGLSRLAARLLVPQTTAHRALADAETTAGVLHRLLEPVGGWGISLCDALLQQGGPVAFRPAARASVLPIELEEALEQRMPCRMEYLDEAANRTHRVISPIHLKRKNGELLLVAFCELRQAQRTFKLARIVRVLRMDDPFVEQLSLPFVFPVPSPAVAGEGTRESK